MVSKNKEYLINLFSCIGKYYILPISVFFLFKNFIDKILKNFVVNPIFSSIYPANLHYDIGILLITLAFLFWFIHKLKNRANIPQHWYFITLSYLTIFYNYRYYNSPFEFTSFSFTDNLKLLDILPIILGLGCFSGFVVTKFSKEKNETDSNVIGFSVDDASEISTDNDLLGINDFVTELANRIKNTNSQNGSFSIGIVAKWGLGKSTFLNSLKNKFNSHQYVVIELNVWKYTSPNQIIEGLFDSLKEKLTKFSFTINSKVQTYSTNLLKGTKNENLNGLKNLIELFHKDNNTKLQYDTVNQEIKAINKKIIIFIDDLDRLDKKEIYEVIRLIRNTANFSNTFFVVAYDRNYILNAIEDINPSKTNNFLEKIFQLEFTLPPIPLYTIQNEVSKRLIPLLSENDKEVYEEISKSDVTLYNNKILALTSLFINNIRDVVRFINSLSIRYNFLKNEVYFPDFYNLELIRFKHPELFTEIYNRTKDFFTTESLENSNVYTLITSTGKSESELSTFLLDSKKSYKLDDFDINNILKAYNSIFSNPNNSVYRTKTEYTNNHLTVAKPSNYNRYFMLSLEGKLSEIKFSKILQLPLNEAEVQLEELSKNSNLGVEILERFYNIKDFDNREGFEKIISLIFCFSNIENEGYKRFFGEDYIGYNSQILADLLGNEKSIAFYNNDKKMYQLFLKPFLYTQNNKFTYTNRFIHYLIRDGFYRIQNILNSDEITEISFCNFKKAIEITSTFSKKLWWFYMNCEYREEVSEGSHTNIYYKISEKATLLMRDFIIKKDTNGFIQYSLQEVPFDERYTLNGAVKIIFRKESLFIRFIQIYKIEFTYKDEFIKFFNTISENNAINFKSVEKAFFKTIPINEKL